MALTGSRTEKNLLAAFAGESQAHMRYIFFAGVARKEGYEQIGSIFLETAENEKEHAKLFFRQLEGGDAVLQAGYPAGIIGTTAGNLRAAAEGEKIEWGSIYPNFAEIAKEEGFFKAEETFRKVALVEVSHEKRYRKLLAHFEQSRIFKREARVFWKCRNCGYVVEGDEAPDPCPVCDHPVAYYEILCENY